jgi:hypothetical protein
VFQEAELGREDLDEYGCERQTASCSSFLWPHFTKMERVRFVEMKGAGN